MCQAVMCEIPRITNYTESVILWWDPIGMISLVSTKASVSIFPSSGRS